MDIMKTGCIDQVRFRRALEFVKFPLNTEDLERFARMTDKND